MWGVLGANFQGEVLGWIGEREGFRRGGDVGDLGRFRDHRKKDVPFWSSVGR